jgi:hypothetical protein
MLGKLYGLKNATHPTPEEGLASFRELLLGTDVEQLLRKGGEQGLGPGNDADGFFLSLGTVYANRSRFVQGWKYRWNRNFSAEFVFFNAVPGISDTYLLRWLKTEVSLWVGVR